jgi:hypothetical protein
MLTLSLVLGAVMSSNEAFERKPPIPERKRPERNDVPFTTIDSGSNSGVDTRGGVTVRDQGEWLALWRRHTANQHPAPPAPTVDFSSEMVVAVFSGQRRSGGFSIQIDRIKSTGSKLMVMVSESSPTPGSINMMMITQPYYIVRLGKSPLPVVFQGL